MSDRIFAVIWLCVCGLICVQMALIEIPFSYEPVGPKAFPILLAILMAGCCLLLIINPDRDIRWPDLPGLGKGLTLIAILLGYALFFEQLGFPLATALMVWVVCLLFGGRPITGLITGVAAGGLGYLFFDRLLQVTLPLGRLWS
ncbi:MAG: tripartite tricarboxylate transporter TctB family protein [Candidatus Competibacterales bacterium]